MEICFTDYASGTRLQYCPIRGDWGELGIPDFVRLSLIKCTVWLLRENQQGRGGEGLKLLPPHPD